MKRYACLFFVFLLLALPFATACANENDIEYEYSVYEYSFSETRAVPTAIGINFTDERPNGVAETREIIVQEICYTAVWWYSKHYADGKTWDAYRLRFGENEDVGEAVFTNGSLQYVSLTAVQPKSDAVLTETEYIEIAESEIAAHWRIYRGKYQSVVQKEENGERITVHFTKPYLFPEGAEDYDFILADSYRVTMTLDGFVTKLERGVDGDLDLFPDVRRIPIDLETCQAEIEAVVRSTEGLADLPYETVIHAHYDENMEKQGFLPYYAVCRIYYSVEGKTKSIGYLVLIEPSTKKTPSN